MKQFLALAATVALATSASYTPYVSYNPYPSHPVEDCKDNEVLVGDQCLPCVTGENGVAPHRASLTECRCPATYEYNFVNSQCENDATDGALNCAEDEVIYQNECRKCVTGRNGVQPHAIRHDPIVGDECRCPAEFEYNFYAQECQLDCGHYGKYNSYYNRCDCNWGYHYSTYYHRCV